jgi:hypothetical protein
MTGYPLPRHRPAIVAGSDHAGWRGGFMTDWDLVLLGGALAVLFLIVAVALVVMGAPRLG